MVAMKEIINKLRGKDNENSSEKNPEKFSEHVTTLQKENEVSELTKKSQTSYNNGSRIEKSTIDYKNTVNVGDGYFINEHAQQTITNGKITDHDKNLEMQCPDGTVYDLNFSKEYTQQFISPQEQTLHEDGSISETYKEKGMTREKAIEANNKMLAAIERKAREKGMNDKAVEYLMSHMGKKVDKSLNPCGKLEPAIIKNKMKLSR